MTRADILLSINANLDGIRKAQEATLDLKRSMRTAADEVNSVGKGMAGIGTEFKSTLLAGVGLGAGFTAGAAAANAILGTIRSITGAIKDTVTEGVRFNATLETSKIGVASVLKQFDTRGKYNGMSAALMDAETIIDQLKKKALETSATFEELLTAYQGTAGAMASAGIPLGRQVDLIVNISQAMGALGIRTEEMRQEATALLMGNIDRNARLAQTLGITSEQIHVMKEQGRLYEFLTEKLKAFGDAAGLAQNSIAVLESNLKDARTQVAAEQTKELAGAYGELLKSLTALVQSDAYKKTLKFYADMKAGVLGNLREIADWLSGAGSKDGPNGMLLKTHAKEFKAFQDKAENVRSPEDISDAQASGRYALRWMYQTRDQMPKTRGGPIDRESYAAVQQLIQATERELELLQKQGEVRIANNKKADDEARIQQLATKWAKEAEDARIEGVKKYATESERTRERVLAAAKQLNPAMYLDFLKSDMGSLQYKLSGPDAQAARYLGGQDGKDPEKVRAAETAAQGYRLEIQGKIAAIQKEIDATQDAIAKKSKTDQDQKIRAEVRYLQVKAQDGTITEKIAALDAEKNALDKTSLNYRADALAIELRIAKLKDDEAARTRAEASRAEQRKRQSEVQTIRDNQFLTERERRERLYNAFKREQDGIAQRIAAAEKLVNTQPEGSATRAQAQSELDQLYSRRDVGLPSDLAQNRPMSWIEETNVALAQLRDGFRTTATSIADVMGSAISSVSNGLQGLFSGTMTLGQAVDSVWIGIGQSVNRVISDMLAQWIVKHTVMAAWSKLFAAEDVATHAGAEGAKTVATGVGAAARSGIRVGETATDVTLTAVKTGAHVAGEATKTSATLFGGVIRIGVAIKEAIASVFTAGVGALQAMASIPYVGPILAVAAMGAVIAAGMGIVKGISKGFKKGGYTGAGDPNEVAGSVHYEEVVFNRDDVRRHGGVAAVEALRVRGGGLADPAKSARSAVASAPVESNGSAGPTINQAFFNNQQDAEQWLRSQRGRRVMVDFVKGIQTEIS